MDPGFSDRYGEEKPGVGGRSLLVSLAVRGRRPCIVLRDTFSLVLLGLEVPFVGGNGTELSSRHGGDFS